MKLTGNKTLWAYMLEQNMLTNQPYYPLPNTTLNEKFNIYPDTAPTVYTYPTINLLTIGTGNARLIDAADYDFMYSNHSPLHGALYNHMPFKIHLPNDVLTSDEINIYRLKTNIVINGTEYTAYYGLKIGTFIPSSEINIVDKTNITNTKLDTTQEPSILNPDKYTPTVLNKYLSTSSVIQIDLDGIVLENLMDVSEILKDNDMPYNITELGICSSVDVNVGTYTEAIWTQIMYFLDLQIDLAYRYNEYINSRVPFTLNINISGNEPIKV